MPLSQQVLELGSYDDLMKIQGNYHELSDDQRSACLDKERQYKMLKKLPTDPADPFFYHVYSDTLPPREAYLIMPLDRNLVTESLESMKAKGYKRRNTFDD